MNYYKIQSIRALFISIGDAQKATILRNERHLGNPYSCLINKPDLRGAKHNLTS